MVTYGLIFLHLDLERPENILEALTPADTLQNRFPSQTLARSLLALYTLHLRLLYLNESFFPPHFKLRRSLPKRADITRIELPEGHTAYL